jgi:predicted type IV restriction endonuclease
MPEKPLRMDQEQKQELKRLAEMSADDIGRNENNVKYNFIIPFLESFGYNKKLDFEHSAQGARIDILIKSSDYKILIEAKSSDRNLDDYLSQLKRYCDELSPILAIITNGEDIRFYSPFWRRSNFNERLIYSITRQDISDDDTIEKIERVLVKQFLEDGSIVEHTEEREREISSIKKEIQSLESSYQDKIVSIDNEVKSLEEQNKSVQLQINQKKNDLSDLEREKAERIKELKKQNLFYLSEPNLYTPVSSEPNPRGNERRYDHFTDYLIPAIRMIKKGVKHNDAFNEIATKLGVTYQTVNAQCTRTLKISTEKFAELIKNNRIKTFLKERFPRKADYIEREL